MTTTHKTPRHARRVREIFGLPPDAPLPPVNSDTLWVFREHLAMNWSGSYEPADYQEPGRDQTSEVILCGISEWVDEVAGVLGSIAGDLAHPQKPLNWLRLSRSGGFGELVEDYQQWFREGTTRAP